MLHLLLVKEVPGKQTRATVNFACPNCGEVGGSLTSPYCSTVCRDQAAFVRQVRYAILTNSITEPEKQVVFGAKLWWLLGGGLPMRVCIIPESAKKQVIKRSGGKCEFCSEPFTNIENFGSG